MEDLDQRDFRIQKKDKFDNREEKKFKNKENTKEEV